MEKNAIVDDTYDWTEHRQVHRLMEDILYLVHRIPYPPNKGDKIRSYHILRHLQQRCRVHLAAFVDDPEDNRYRDELAQMCSSLCLRPLNPLRAKLRSLSGVVTGSPLSVPYYHDAEMHGWVDQTIANYGIRKSLVFSSSMAQYVYGDKYRQLTRWIDFVDIDSDKWAQYQKTASFLMRPVYQYEARSLFAWEKEVAQQFDAAFFVSHAEAEMFRSMAPEVANKVAHFNNGVDTDFFNPDHVYESPYATHEKVLVFTGAMDYWANVDAVVWFAQEVFAPLSRQDSDLRFYIVGSKPDEKVMQLSQLPGVVVTGAVNDIRPYIAHAALSVAPMRIARGIQNKVLEAMAMAKPVVVSPQGYEGITAITGSELAVVMNPQEWGAAILRLLHSKDGYAMGAAARARVLKDYSWDGALMPLDALC
jgi:sugar transferase (PEP-CTERM/EpsH1 system associated)